MSVRSAPSRDYPIRVCSLPLPEGVKAASIEGHALPLPHKNPDRILLTGDTGCRITKLVNQSCNDAAEWPFPSAASVEAAKKPDLVVHVGDFHYRESACRPLNKGCAGSPHGDQWAVWEADFFKPAKPLLDSVPFVLVRGNHEECERGGIGWSRTLDPYPFVSKTDCLGLGAPFVADIGSPKIVVIDTSTAGENRVREKEAEVFRAQFQSVATLVPQGPVWLAFHRPIWASGGSALGFTLGDNKTLAAAAHDSLPANVDTLLSGHIHTFQVLGYQQDLPVQIISGHGGDELHTLAPSDPVGLTINGVKVVTGRGAPGMFGFVLLQRDGAGWQILNHDMEGKVHDTCRMEGRHLSC
jgi:predicted phosphodiesterase